MWPFFVQWRISIFDHYHYSAHFTVGISCHCRCHQNTGVLNVRFRFVSLTIPFGRGQDTEFKFWMQTELVNFTDWLSFLTSNLTEEIKARIHEPSSQISKAFNQHGAAEKIKKIFTYKYFNVAYFFVFYTIGRIKYESKYMRSNT